MKKNPSIAIVRGKFLNRYEMQFFEPLTRRFDITAFGSLAPFHDKFTFPVVKLASPMDIPQFPYKESFLNRMFIDAHYLRGLEDKLKGFDLVHTAETYYRYTQQALNAKKKGYVKKVIATVLETIPFNNEGIWGRKQYKEHARKELDHMIALTNLSKSTLIKEGADPEKITVIGHFVDTKRFFPRQRAIHDNLTILFVGRLEAEKGVLDILKSMRIIASDPLLRATHLIWRFIGNGSKRNDVLDAMKTIPKNWQLELQSAMYDQMPDLYRQADIFVAPSKPKIRWGKPTWEEQYCTALLEAQASGLPIVTTQSGGIPENVGNAAVCILPGDVYALTKEISRFLQSPQKRKDYASCARKRAVAVHDIAIGAGKIADLYNRLLVV